MIGIGQMSRHNARCLPIHYKFYILDSVYGLIYTACTLITTRRYICAQTIYTVNNLYNVEIVNNTLWTVFKDTSVWHEYVFVLLKLKIEINEYKCTYAIVSVFSVSGYTWMIILYTHIQQKYWLFYIDCQNWFAAKVFNVYNNHVRFTRYINMLSCVHTHLIRYLSIHAFYMIAGSINWMLIYSNYCGCVTVYLVEEILMKHT